MMREKKFQAPKVSVVITTRNRAVLLPRAIDSVIQQTYENFEIIIVDDNSTDETSVVVEKYSSKFPKIVYTKNSDNIGVAASRNIGVRMASGSFVTGLDDDDEFALDRLDYFVRNFEEKWSFLCTGLLYFNKGKYYPKRNNREIFSFQDLMFSNRASHAFFLKERYLEIGGQDETLLACEDYDFWIRMTEKYGDGLRLPKPTYVVHDEHGFERKGISKNKIKGQRQFIKKHRHKMTKSQLNAQLLQAKIRESKPLSLSELKYFISPRIAWKAIKYYLQSNYPILKAAEQKANRLKARKHLSGKQV